MIEDLLAQRKRALAETINSLFRDARPHSQAFALRVLGDDLASTVLKDKDEWHIPNLLLESTRYGGFPPVSYLGFWIGYAPHEKVTPEIVERFVSGVWSIVSREDARLKGFIGDDIAVLGIADGIAKLLHKSNEEIEVIKQKFLGILARHTGEDIWSRRARALAGDLIDNSGRLRISVQKSVDELALEFCLRAVWPDAFRGHKPLSQEMREFLLEEVFAETLANTDLEQAVVRLVALNILLRQAVKSIVPSVSDTVRILRKTLPKEVAL